MKMFIAAGWRDGIEGSRRMRDRKSIFWTLCLPNVSEMSTDCRPTVSGCIATIVSISISEKCQLCVSVGSVWVSSFTSN